jgi:glycosyltransferase involved in cell wall biosynthesis
MHPPALIVYRNQPLPISEAFVYNQSMLLRRYKAFFLGAKYPSGPRIPLPTERVQLINKGGPAGLLREVLFKFLGLVPQDVVAWATAIRPGLVHAHFGPDGAMIMPLARRLSVPLVVSFLGTDATLKDQYARRSYLSQRLYLLRRARLAKETTKVIVPSQFLKRRVIEHGFDPESIELIHHGVDLSQFAVTGMESVQWGRVLFVGRLVERKGLQFLIEALARARTRFPGVRLTVIGDGPSRAEYEAQADRMLAGCYEFLGAQPQEVVRDHLRQAYLFCMPSITMPSGEVETFGLVFVEAQAMCVPVVSFESGGIPEVVAHGITGLLAREGDVAELATCIELLLENAEVRDKMGRSGRLRVEQMFDLARQNECLESLYDRLTSRPLRQDQAPVAT